MLFAAVLTVARGSLADHYRVPTGSMEPTVEPGDRIVVAKVAYGLMRYRQRDSCACREVGGRQVFQVVVKGRLDLAEALAERGRQRLLAGEELSAVRGWLLTEKLALQTPPE